MEGLLRNDTNIHAGIRTTLSGPSDYENDGYCGFEIVEAREIDTIGTLTFPVYPFQSANCHGIGTDGIIKKIRDRVGTEHPVYLSIDIDTLDPACKLPINTPFVFVSVAKDPVQQSPRALAPPRPAVGRRVSCELSSAALMV